MNHVLAVLVELLMTVLPAQTPAMVWPLILEPVQLALALLMLLIVCVYLVTHHVQPVLGEILMSALLA